MDPGDVFTHRNVGNIVSHSDMNCMSVLDYGIGALKVKHVIVCGHYGCGAVKAALTLPAKTGGCVSCWIGKIREVRNKYSCHLCGLSDEKRYELLCELNAIEQMVNVCTSPAVQAAWANETELYVHCLLYDIATGHLTPLVPALTSLEKLLEMTEFHDGVCASMEGVKALFDDSIKGLIAQEKAIV